VLRELGKLDDNEMYRTFNMGIGLVMVVPETAVAAMRQDLAAFSAFPLYEIGRVVSGTQSVRLIES
jgi:phosphoribosylformylglycinamidine cyclo-ligase